MTADPELRPAPATPVAGLVAEVWRYPVKSMRGERLDAAPVGPRGIVGDRAYGVYDPAGEERALSAKQHPELLLAWAAYRPAGVVVTLPDGTRHRGPSAELDRALSGWLGHPVELRARERLAKEAPLHLLSTASLRAAAALHPAGDWAACRFRPNVLLDVAGTSYAEDSWLAGGAELVLGEVGCLPTKTTVRCALVGHGQPGVAADPDVLEVLRAGHDTTLGVYAAVTRPGCLRSGDRVTA